MLMVEANQIVQSKTIMAIHKVHTILWLMVTPLVDIRTATNARGDVSNHGSAIDHSGIPPNKVTNMVAEFTIPIGPAGSRKVSHLIETGGVPSFCDNLCVHEYVVKLDLPKHWRVL